MHLFNQNDFIDQYYLVNFKSLVLLGQIFDIYRNKYQIMEKTLYIQPIYNKRLKFNYVFKCDDM